MRRLFPADAPTGSPDAATADRAGVPDRDGSPEWSLDALAEAYAYPSWTGSPGAGGRSWLRANMVTSLDGAAHHGGRSQPLSSPADMRIFGVLRGLADVVVVGAETVRQEGYRPARRREAFAARREAAGQGPAPTIAVVSAGLDLDFSLPLFTEPLVPTLLLTGARAPADRVREARAAGVELVFAGESALVDPTLVPGALAERGLTRQLTEGGPTLLGRLTAAGVLDELCLAVAPRVALGSAARVMNGPVLDTPTDFALHTVLEDDGILFTRYRKIGESAE
jgi:riboflavin biosynthesis pyrimidine reductase